MLLLRLETVAASAYNEVHSCYQVKINAFENSYDKCENFGDFQFVSLSKTLLQDKIFSINNISEESLVYLVVIFEVIPNLSYF